MTVSPYYPGQPVQVFAPVRPASGKATASMVLGLIGALTFCLVIPSVVAVILGHVALRETSTGAVAGRGQAVAGLVLGYVMLLPGLLGVIFLAGPLLLLPLGAVA